MKKIKKIIIAFVLFAAVMLFVACDAKINVYRYIDEHFYYEDIQIAMSLQTEQNINESATKDAYGNYWTLTSYFTDAAICANTMTGADIQYSFFDRFSNTASGKVSFYIVGKKPLKDVNDDFVTSKKIYENLFIGVMEFGCSSVFDGINEQLSSDSLNASNAVIAVRGIGAFPSIYEAFPALNFAGASGLLSTTEYISSNRKSVTANGDKANIATVYGTGTATDVDFVAFNGVLGDTSDEPLKFETKYYVSVGWFIVACVAGILTVSILIFYLRTKKKSKAAAVGSEATVQEVSEDGLIEDQKIDMKGSRIAPPFYPRTGPYGNPYQGNPYQGNPYQGNPYQGSPYQGNPYQGNPYQGNPYQGNPYQGNPYQGNPYAPPYINNPASFEPFSEFNDNNQHGSGAQNVTNSNSALFEEFKGAGGRETTVQSFVTADKGSQLGGEEASNLESQGKPHDNTQHNSDKNSPE